eukprot:TRINITY_DN3956_c2_g1_i2.p1 TRINITY_DN3956_c2_g1~~TRINITY_DN3956_c2_g1_i2.p1  ORF type:complete len:346 (-),score=117.99 TRINITY_DN3956_c2_g1_i2:27-1016(-)
MATAQRNFNRSTPIVKSYLNGHRAPINCLSLNYSKSLLISGSEDSIARIWDLSKRKSIRGLCAPTGEIINSVCFHPKDDTKAYIAYSSTIAEFDLRRSEIVLRTEMINKQITVHQDEINKICFNSTASLISSSDDSGLINMINFDTEPTLVKSLNHDVDTICSCIAFNENDQSQLFSASYDCTIKLWDYKRSRLVHEFRVNEISSINPPFIHDISISNRYLGAALGNSTAIVFDIPTRKQIQTLDNHFGAVCQFKWIFSNQWITTATTNGKIFIWKFKTKKGNNPIEANLYIEHRTNINSIVVIDNYNTNSFEILVADTSNTITTYNVN